MQRPDAGMPDVAQHARTNQASRRITRNEKPQGASGEIDGDLSKVLRRLQVMERGRRLVETKDLVDHRF
jgi:hypothetical protein